MALIKVRRLNFDATYTYAPPQEEAVVNTEHVVAVTVTDARGAGPFLRVGFDDGSSMVIVGTVDGFFRQVALASWPAAGAQEAG